MLFGLPFSTFSEGKNEQLCLSGSIFDLFASKTVPVCLMDSIYNPNWSMFPYVQTIILMTKCTCRVAVLAGVWYVVFLSLQTSSNPWQCESHFQPTSTNSVCPISASSAAAERVDHIASGCSGCQVSPSPRQTGQTTTPVETSKDSSDHSDIWDSSTSSSVLSPETFRHDSYCKSEVCQVTNEKLL